MKLSLQSRLHALEIFWRAFLAALPIVLVLFLLTPLRGFWVYATATALGAAALIGWDFYWSRRELTRMHRDVSFNHWLDQVEAYVRQYGAAQIERDIADWEIDFEAGLSAQQAAKNFLARRREWPR